MKKFFTLLFLVLIASSWSLAQNTFPNNGPYDKRERVYAFTNATIFKSYNEKIENATLVIRKGKVEAIGINVPIPKDAVIMDLKGKYIYPSFIDLFSDYGMPEPKAEGKNSERPPQMLSNKKGAFSWNEALKSEFRAYENFVLNTDKAKEYRNIGFGTLLSHRADGISRGSAVLVSLGETREHELILKQKAAHILTFSKGTSTQTYPSSLMGSIALLRQTYNDGQWYKTQKEEYNASLEAWNDLQSLPQIFAVGDKFDAIRAIKVAKEFNANYIIKGAGNEYQRIDALKATGASFILPVKYPDAYDVEDPYDALQVNLSEMKHWELAPSNAGRLAKAGIEIALTSNGLKERNTFLANIRKAIENGLSESDALKALTATPAKLIGASNELGSLEQGKWANFIISSMPVFAKEAKIYHNWVQGEPFVINELDAPNLLGAYNLNIENTMYKLNVEGNPEKPDMVVLKNDTTRLKVNYSLGNGTITLSFSPEKENLVRLNGYLSGNNWIGRGNLSDGTWVNWKATYQNTLPIKEVKKDEKANDAANLTGDIIYPFIPFGSKEIPKQGVFLIKNATVWTNEKEGILKNTDVLLQSGKIVQIGKNLKMAGATEIDATNKHFTAGILDEHSHIAISRGVNEGSQESSAEVRIGDVVNSDDINIYRNLAGGVTASHLLHGSANPIGGQTQLIKLRWGYEPEKMKFENWDGFIKFALGENVKQSNWDEATVRFPQTRMGVEQVYEDYFTRAEEYAKLKATGKPVRKDLDLETIQEILEKKRFITCHSYVQSEINMFMKVAERHNFRINTFTHILEGYKVADKMKSHGVGASTFSDWWAYKHEVYHAIPYNAAMMHAQGVVVAINSDDAEMSRRLNQEAAKAVEYGEVSEEDAWKFVTLNPAKLMHVDNRIGSVKVGKDADVVLWSDNPLSTYAKAEMTFVDGIKFFDRQEDTQKQGEIQKERARIILKMIAAKKGGDATQPAIARPPKLYHCDDEEVEVQ
ncbi:MAG: hypothetical protein RLZZ292_260 [Bacteroidota bacterium]|jgi:imidazolonepropionase-like amidohydrolase